MTLALIAAPFTKIAEAFGFRQKARIERAKKEARRKTVRDAWRRSKNGLIVVVAITGFINILKLTLPLYIFQLLDRVIASRSVDTLILLTAITVFAIVIASLAEVIRRWMLVHWGGWIEQYFGKQLFLGSLSGRRARGPSRALQDLSDVSQFVSGPGMTSWLDAMWAPAFLLLVYLIHPLLALIVLFGMISMVVLGIMNELITRPMRAAARKARLNSQSWESTAQLHLETVSSLNVGEKVAERWFESMSLRRKERFAGRLTSATMNETMRFVEALQRIACYGMGVWLAISDSLTVGAIIAGAVLGRLGTSAVRKAMSQWRNLVLTGRAYRRVDRRLMAIREPRLAIRDPDAALTLHLDQLTHTHNAWSRPIFRQLDLTVEPGEILCVMGPSGSGKTTLARLMAGVASPTMGAVRLGELDIARFSLLERQRLLGYLQQDTTLLHGTIAENITSLRDAEPREIVEAARLAGIHDVVAKLPEGYETEVSDQYTALAGGEIRRLGLARALFGRPRLIVLDEPEANLDDQLVGLLLHTLEQCKSWGSVVVVTSQSARLAMIADKIIVLDKEAKLQIFETRDEFTRSGFASAEPRPAQTQLN